MIFRALKNRGRKLTAYGLFSSFPEKFSAILEDPSGHGRQFLVSSEGREYALGYGEDASSIADFFSQWSEDAAVACKPSPAIRSLFYAAYEAGGIIEVLPKPKTATEGPLLWRFLPDFSLCFEGETIHIAAKNEELLVMLQQLMAHVEPVQWPEDPPWQLSESSYTVTDADAYKRAVECVRHYIREGDTFQANIARFWSMPFAKDDLYMLYHHLRAVNPAPFMHYLHIASSDFHLLSASPERLFRMHADGSVDTRPIAGTRRRAEGEVDDDLRAELLLSEKERAEHIMLVDLERNDIGRVCVPGSVEVDECMVIEQYATVQHIVSNVRGILDTNKSVVDVFRAMFPGGTITGCPKVRCMEIIHELEAGARGPYTGGVGYQAWDGSADMNILIRTFWHAQDHLHWAAGAGIVADSDAERELVETAHKAEGLLRALQ